MFQFPYSLAIIKGVLQHTRFPVNIAKNLFFWPAEYNK